MLDIDQELLTFTREPREGLVREAQSYVESTMGYLAMDDSTLIHSPGQRVRHPAFGVGTVLSVDMDQSAHVIQFDGMQTPRRISFRAKLERGE